MSCSETRVKLYDLLVDGYHTPRSAEDIANLYRSGRLRKSDPCRLSGTKDWKTLDELFPLLKYDSRRLSSFGLGSTNSIILDHAGVTGAPRPAMTSALKAGWICFGIGLTISWFFPLGNAFFSIALITAVVAMCTHQVNRGLALLISSFCGIALCTVVFFALALGTVAVAGATAIEKANADLRRTRDVQRQALGQLNTSFQRMQTVAPSMPSLPVTVTNYSVARPPIVAIPTPAPRERTTQENVRQAEMERDRINAKDQRIRNYRNQSTHMML